MMHCGAVRKTQRQPQQQQQQKKKSQQQPTRQAKAKISDPCFVPPTLPGSLSLWRLGCAGKGGAIGLGSARVRLIHQGARAHYRHHRRMTGLCLLGTLLLLGNEER